VPDGRLSRRKFLKGACASAAGVTLAAYGTALPAVARNAGTSDPKGMLTGFVVADAHFGWDKPDVQPPAEVIRAMMERILRRFPDLDLFVDAGDAHHGFAEDRYRGEWTDVIANGCGQVPFLFVAGNHDIMNFENNEDTELRCNRLGSAPCRPYYSFDLKGIHFLSLPELMSVCIVTREALEWAALDLETNRERTTVILSHNSIANTTRFHYDPGYRKLANSEEIFDLINRYPNVLAWMHGHNHTWEIVRKSGKLYVSCGRIGGFNPPPMGRFGQGHLGGIYFEVAPDRFCVRGYSATENRFFDELEHYAHLTQTIEGLTTYNPSAPACISYGVGGAPDGQRVRAANHYIGQSVRREVFLSGCCEGVLNENADIQHYARRPIAGKLLPALGLHPFKNEKDPRKPAWDWLDPGIRINPLDNPECERVLTTPKPEAGRVAYYRCAPGRRYSAAVDAEAEDGGQSLKLECQVHDNEGNLLTNLAVAEWRIEPGRRRYEADFEVPAFNGTPTIYSDQASGRTMQLMISATIGPSVEPIVVRHFGLALAGASEKTEDAAILVDGAEFRKDGILGEAQCAVLPVPGLPGSHTLFEARAGGCGRVTWLVRHEGVQWQVRNATVQATEQGMAVGPLRNTFCPKNEIVIAPMCEPTCPYVSRTRNLDRFTVRFPAAGNRSLTIAAEELLGPAEIEVVSEFKPSEVSGVAKWEYSQGRVLMRVDKPGRIVLG